MSQEVTVVFTAKSVDRILAEAGVRLRGVWTETGPDGVILWFALAMPARNGVAERKTTMPLFSLVKFGTLCRARPHPKTTNPRNIAT